ncbi:GM16722, partial [Drosophila sechellia]
SESCNTRKSRRLQEKEDRSTVDDIIEDVVRNTNTPTGTGPHLPKGAQTPPRRSGRNAPAQKTDAVQIINAVGRPRRSKDRKTIGEQTANLIEEVTASNATVGASHLAPPEGAGVESHVPQLDAKEVEPVSVVAPISTPAPVSVAVPVTVPVPAMVPVKPTMPQHPKKKAIAAAEIESYQAINSSIPSGGLPMHQTAAPATQKITGGVADAVSKALVDPVTGVITAGMPQGKEGNLPAATAAAPANSSNEDGQAGPTPQLQQQQQQHPQQPPQQQANLQINTTLIPSGLPNPITALGKSVQLETSAAALLNKPVSVLVKGNASQVIQQQQPQIVAQPKQPIILQQNPLPTVLQHAQHSTVRPPQPLKAHVLNREKNIQQQLTPTKQAVGQPPQHAPHSGHMLLTDTAGNQQLVQPQIIARHLQQQQHLQVNVPPPAAHSPHSPRIPSQQQQLGPGSAISPQQQQPQTMVIKQAASAAPPQILHVVSSKASVVPQPQQQQLPPTSSTGPHLQLTKPNYSYAPTVLTPTLPAVQQQQQQHLYKQNNQQKGAQVQMPPHGIIMPNHPGMLLQQKLPAHLQPQQHQLNPSPPPGKPNPVLHGLQSGQIIPGSVGSPPPVSAAVLKSAQQQVNSVVPVAGRTAIPNISPQSQPRVSPLVLPPGISGVPPFDASLHDLGAYVSGRRTQSPPPAHQQASPITPNDSTYRGVTASRDFMLYQHHLMRGGDYDDKMGSSPPLELRRPGSGPPRTIAVPHSLQSPQDRTAADSPQMAQVYVHNTRIPPAHFSEIASRGLYESGALQLEPPPAHRPTATISVVVPQQMPAVSSGSPFIGRDGSVQPGSHHHPGKGMDMQLDEMDRMSMIAAVVKQQQEHLLPALPAGMELAAQQAPPAMAPPPGDSLVTLLQRYPVMWQGLLALKTDQAAVQMHFVHGNPNVARASLPSLVETNTPLLRIAQRMRLEQTQLEGVAKKMQVDKEHCMLLALPCGRDHADVLQHSRNLQTGFITYLQQKMAAGIVNIPIPGSEQAAYVVHIFPSCDFANENLERAAPDLKNRVAELAHLLIVIATV